MGTLPLSPAGAYGLNLDVPPAELIETAWSSGLNVRFADGGLGPFGEEVPLGITFTEQPNWAISCPRASSNLAAWLFPGTTGIEAYVAGALTDVTRDSGAYTGAEYNRWSGGSLSGVTILNNGIDVPQAWLSSDPDLKLIDLPAWPTNTRAKVLRTYHEYGLALNVTQNGIKYRSMVKWSHPADPGACPISWDETDPTKDAGEYSLAETPGEVVDSLPLGNSVNIIYKEDSVWGMQYIGGMYIFRFYLIFPDFGMPRQDCAIAIPSNRHLVFTGTDIKVHDGQQHSSILAGRMANTLRSLSAEQLKTCFFARNDLNKEAWFCYRRSHDGVVAADTALVYNWENNTLTMRELADYRFIASGPLDPPGTGNNSWHTATYPWSEAKLPWGVATIAPSSNRMMALGDKKLVWVDAVNQVTPQCTVERVNLGIAMKAGKAPDLSADKFLTRVWPRITGKTGDVVWITLGGSDIPQEAIRWEPPQQFRIGIDSFVDATVSAKMLAVRLESNQTATWKYNGADVEVIQTN